MLYPIEKQAKDFKRQFSKDMQMANEHMERCSISPDIREINAHQNHKIPLHIHWNGCNQTDNNKCH